MFHANPKLKTINLSQNRLKSINRNVFYCLEYLVSLNISKNPQLSIIDPGLFRGLISLKEVFLSGNNISNFPLVRLFQSCRNLEVLDLSNNKLDNRIIDEEAMSYGRGLKELKLSNNQLENMEFVRNLSRLEELDLSSNKIESVVAKDGFNLFGRLLNLSRLDLSENKIRTFDESILAYLPSNLYFLNLSENLLESDEKEVLKSCNKASTLTIII